MRPVRAKDPTPEEIAARCAEIRAGWSDYVRERRQAAVGAVPWEIERNMPHVEFRFLSEDD